MRFLIILPLLLSVCYGFNLFSNNMEDVIKSAIVYDCATAGSGAKLPVLNDCSRFVLCDGNYNMTLTCRLSEPHFDRCKSTCVNDMTVCNQASCDSPTTTTTTTIGASTTSPPTTITTTQSPSTTKYTAPTVSVVTTTASGATTTTEAAPKTCTANGECSVADCSPNPACDDLCICDIGVTDKCIADSVNTCPPAL